MLVKVPSHKRSLFLSPPLSLSPSLYFSFSPSPSLSPSLSLSRSPHMCFVLFLSVCVFRQTHYHQQNNDSNTNPTQTWIAIVPAIYAGLNGTGTSDT